MSFWDRIAGVYDLAERFNRRAYVETLRQVGELVPQWASVLECAGGTGEFSLAAAERAGAVMCTDLSQAMLDKAEAKARRRGITNISFLVRDMNALPDGEGTYDVVIAANVLHLLLRPERALGALGRVTARGGAADIAHLSAGGGRALGQAVRPALSAAGVPVPAEVYPDLLPEIFAGPGTACPGEPGAGTDPGGAGGVPEGIKRAGLGNAG